MKKLRPRYYKLNEKRLLDQYETPNTYIIYVSDRSKEKPKLKIAEKLYL